MLISSDPDLYARSTKYNDAVLRETLHIPYFHLPLAHSFMWLRVNLIN
jgi:hypothetical protein